MDPRPALRTTANTRHERLLSDLEAIAIDALSVANRFTTMEGLRPVVAARGASLHAAALAFHDAFAAFNGAQSKDLQLYFGMRNVFIEQFDTPSEPLAVFDLQRQGS